VRGAAPNKLRILPRTSQQEIARKNPPRFNEISLVSCVSPGDMGIPLEYTSGETSSLPLVAAQLLYRKLLFRNSMFASCVADLSEWG
jgi:hypothetical protein